MEPHSWLKRFLPTAGIELGTAISAAGNVNNLFTLFILLRLSGSVMSSISGSSTGGDGGGISSSFDRLFVYAKCRPEYLKESYFSGQYVTNTTGHSESDIYLI